MTATAAAAAAATAGRRAAAVLAVLAVLAARPAAADEADEFLQTPRYGGPTRFEPDSAEYQTSLLVMAIVPLCFSFLTLVAAVVVLSCRCCARCCACCRKCAGSGEGRAYGRVGVWAPVLVLLVGTAFGSSFSAVGLSSSEKLTDALLAVPDNATDTLTLSLRASLPNNLALVRSRLSLMREPLLELLADLAPTVAAAGQVLNESIALVDSGFDGLLVEMRAFRAAHGVVEVAAPDGVNYTCDECADTSTLVTAAVSQLDVGAGRTVSDARDLHASFVSDIGEREVDIRSAATDVDTSLNDADDEVESAQKTIDDVLDLLDEYDPVRHGLTAAALSLTLFSLVVVAGGALLRWGSLLGCNAWLLYLALFMLWALFAFYLPVSFLLADSCEYIKDYEATTMRERAADPADEQHEFFQAITGCLDSKNLVVALNKTADLEFTDTVALPAFGNISQELDVDGLAALEALVDRLAGNRTAAFGFDAAAKIDARWQAFRDDNSPGMDSVTTTAEFLAFDSGAVAGLADEQDAVQAAVDTRDALDARLAEMSASMDAINAARDEAGTRLDAGVALASRATDELGPLFGHTNTFKSRSECTEVKQLYDDTREVACTRVMHEMATLSWVTFFVCAPGVLYLWLSHLSARRVRNRNGGGKEASGAGAGGRGMGAYAARRGGAGRAGGLADDDIYSPGDELDDLEGGRATESAGRSRSSRRSRKSRSKHKLSRSRSRSSAAGHGPGLGLGGSSRSLTKSASRSSRSSPRKHRSRSRKHRK